MSAVLEIQQAIARLSDQERTALRLWLDAYEEDDWDRQITKDAAAGKLSFMTRQAEQAKNEGRLLLLPGEIQNDS